MSTMKFKNYIFMTYAKCIPNETKGREVLFLQALTLHYALIEVTRTRIEKI